MYLNAEYCLLQPSTAQYVCVNFSNYLAHLFFNSLLSALFKFEKLPWRNCLKYVRKFSKRMATLRQIFTLIALLVSGFLSRFLFFLVKKKKKEAIEYQN